MSRSRDYVGDVPVEIADRILKARKKKESEKMKENATEFIKKAHEIFDRIEKSLKDLKEA